MGASKTWSWTDGAQHSVISWRKEGETYINHGYYTLWHYWHNHPYNFWHLEASAAAWRACCLLGQLVCSILWLFSHSSAHRGHSHNTDPGRAEQHHPASTHNNKKRFRDRFYKERLHMVHYIILVVTQCVWWRLKNLDHSLHCLLPSSGSGRTCSRLWRAPVSRRRPDRPEPAEWEKPQMKKPYPSSNCIKEIVYKTVNNLHLKICIPPHFQWEKRNGFQSIYFFLSNWNNEFSFTLTGGLIKNMKWRN